MKPLDRVLNAVNLQSTDTIPVLPLVGIHATEISGVKVEHALRDGREMARAMLFSLRRYGYDGIFPFMDLSAEAEAIGCETCRREGEIPTVVKPVVSSPEDVKRLATPEPSKDGRLPHFLEAIKSMSEEVGKEVAVCAYVTGPLTLASHLIGMTELFLNIRRNPDMLDELLDFTAQVGATYGKALVNSGSHVIMILEPVAALVSPAHFRRFVSSRVSAIARELRAPTLLHVCGNASPLLDEMMGTGVNGISIDAPVDIGFAREKTSGRLCLIGNVSPVDVMLHGSPEDVRKACEECIRKGGRRGFVLSSGCEVPKKTPPENLETMVRVARAHVQKDQFAI